MSEGEMLLRAIFDKPECDTARLVYADWLDEQPREMVCVKCKGKKDWVPDYDGAMGDRFYIDCSTCHNTGTVEDDTNAKRAAAIRWFIAHPDYHQSVPITEFVPPLTEFHTSGEVCGVWHRGFGSEVRMRLDDFMRHAGEIFSNHPITKVVLTDREPECHNPPHSDANYSWYIDGFNDDRATIPGAIFDLMRHRYDGGIPQVSVGDFLRLVQDAVARHRYDGGIPQVSVSGGRHAYETVEGAMSALSRASVRFGRNEANRLRTVNV